MTSPGAIKGVRVLLVEDDYYLAADASAAIADAGGEVVGPFATADEAFRAVASGKADVAAIDINLGGGPAFDLARQLRDSGVPFLFATGYDRQSLPDDLVDVVRLEKPFTQESFVKSLAELAARS